jgi:hypothetical protein
MSAPTVRDLFVCEIIRAGLATPPNKRPAGNEAGAIDTKAAWARDVRALADALMRELCKGQDEKSGK